MTRSFTRNQVSTYYVVGNTFLYIVTLNRFDHRLVNNQSYSWKYCDQISYHLNPMTRKTLYASNYLSES